MASTGAGKPKTNSDVEPVGGKPKHVEIDAGKRKINVVVAEGEKDPEKKKDQCVPGSKCEEAIPTHPKCLTDGVYMSTLQTMFLEESVGDEEKGYAKKPLRRPKLTTENTYRLDSKRPFQPLRAEEIIQATFQEQLTDMRYCSKTAIKTCALLAETIRTRILDFEFERYKIVVHVTLGSMNRQGFCNAFNHLGDATRDSYAHGSFVNGHIFVVTSVHAIYYE